MLDTLTVFHISNASRSFSVGAEKMEIIFAVLI